MASFVATAPCGVRSSSKAGKRPVEVRLSVVSWVAGAESRTLLRHGWGGHRVHIHLGAHQPQIARMRTVGLPRITGTIRGFRDTPA